MTHTYPSQVLPLQFTAFSSSPFRINIYRVASQVNYIPGNDRGVVKLGTRVNPL